MRPGCGPASLRQPVPPRSYPLAALPPARWRANVSLGRELLTNWSPYTRSFLPKKNIRDLPMSTPSTAIDSTRKRSAPQPCGQVRQLILLCPDLHETGGIGTVSRLALEALQSYSAATGCQGQVW